MIVTASQLRNGLIGGNKRTAYQRSGMHSFAGSTGCSSCNGAGGGAFAGFFQDIGDMFTGMFGCPGGQLYDKAKGQCTDATVRVNGETRNWRGTDAPPLLPETGRWWKNVLVGNGSNKPDDPNKPGMDWMMLGLVGVVAFLIYKKA